MRSHAIAYAFAIAVVALAAALQERLWSLIPPSPQLLFYPAVLVVASMAGLRPALLAIGLSMLAQARWFLPPASSFAIERTGDMIDLFVYGAIATTTSLLVVGADRARARTRSALRELQVVLDACPAGIVIARRDGALEPNAAAAALASARLPQTMIARALRGERIHGAEIEVPRPGGALAHLLVDAAPIGGDRGAVLAFQDISPLKELDRLRAQWNAIVAHDLRQPIQSILLSTRILAHDEPPPPASSRTPLAVIVRCTRRLDAMVRDLLDASRLEVRNMRLERELVDLRIVVAERVEDTQHELTDRTFELHLEDDELPVMADLGRLAQILGNLLGNAVKYGDPSSPIRVRVGRSANAAFVAVANEGVGFSKQDAEHVFERFRRASSVEQTKVPGIGLGLYIVRELVAAHGGEITCESAPGGTTTFRFTLPLANVEPHGSLGNT